MRILVKLGDYLEYTEYTIVYWEITERILVRLGDLEYTENIIVYCKVAEFVTAILFQVTARLTVWNWNGHVMILYK